MKTNIGTFAPLLLASLLLVGVGCEVPVLSEMNPEKAAMSLSFDLGDTFVLRPTVLGLGGELVNLLGGDATERVVQIDAWTPDESVKLSWTMTTKLETEASVLLRNTYEVEYAETPIGEVIPERPKTEFEETVVAGSLRSESMADAHSFTLPDYWPEGEGGVDKNSSIVWLSTKQYEELSGTRQTEMSLGLFDESLMRAEELSEQVQAFIDKVNGFVPGLLGEVEEVEDTKEPEEDSVTTITARGDWGEYELLVNDVRTKVRTIEARNSFGSFTFLANPMNPILLEVLLTPLAQGTLDAITPSGFVDGFGGYEIYQINNK
ncbi:hypothetical protein HOI18_04980 [Candidatus Uhrbacteria bacterium]|nr:hypothetical protein [Candidatus Uhrbacteria bacterium]